MRSFNDIVLDFYKATENNKHEFHRYKSWEHCYQAFKDGQDIDQLSLHLTVYLSSWGMYRGSSFLLEYDYKVHYKVVELLLENRKLYGLKFDSFEEHIPQIINLHNKICKHYEETLEMYVKNNKEFPVKASETLTTKIIMGALGCVPAYDRFFKEGLKRHRISQAFSQRGLLELSKYIKSQSIDFRMTQLELSKKSAGVNYPEMKLIDMYFFQSARQHKTLNLLKAA